MIVEVDPISQGGSVEGVSPLSTQRWFNEKKDQFSVLKQRFRDWSKMCEENEELFQRYVYNNENPSDGDFRQHRFVLCNMMTHGESIAYDILTFCGDNPETDAETKMEAVSYARFIDQKLAQMRSTFFKWHGDVESQMDFPDSLKEAAREIAAGNIEDWQDL